MKPTIIVHASISLDGRFTGFEVDLGLHYKIASSFHPEAHLVGSRTAQLGIEAGGPLPAEEPSDMAPQGRPKTLPYWIIPDSTGRLMGRLHVLRRFEFCRDVIVLLSQQSPAAYHEYLRKRQYPFFVVGDSTVDLPEAIHVLTAKYSIHTIVTDCGPTLARVLFEHGLVDTLNLLVVPILVGGNVENQFFCGLPLGIPLTLETCESLQGCVWLRYRVGKEPYR